MSYDLRDVPNRIMQTFRRIALAVLQAVRRAPAGRAAARIARRHMPRAYAGVLRRYHAYSHTRSSPQQRAPVRFVDAPPCGLPISQQEATSRWGRALPLTIVLPAGLSLQERFLFQRLALAAHLARRLPGAG